MAESSDRFSCASCQRSYIWKPALAGKRVKCKCGAMMDVPSGVMPQAAPQLKPQVIHRPRPAPVAAASQADDDALYAMADMEAKAAANLPPMVMAAAPVAAVAMAVPGRATTVSGVPLAYRRGPSAKERERAGTNVLIDMNRDVYVPTAMLVGGFLIYAGYYAITYHLGGVAIVITMFGLSLLTAFKAAILVGFALVAATPLGVSFGGVFTAILKLAAIAVFCDGVTTWIDAGVAHISGGAGGGGFFGMGIISWPIALGMYWGFFIYLFSMDPGDSWMVVMILSIIDYLARWVLIALLLSAVLNWGGVASGPIASIGGGGSSKSQASATEEHVTELKESGGLRDARQYITDGHQAGLGPFVESCFAAGAKSVSFEVSRDINGKTDPYALAIELPSEKSKRAAVYAAIKRHYDEAKVEYDPEDLKDDGERYVEVELK
ncbi:MAG TPA: hypothetical protein VLI90_08700 [Tepidisphaeraceae bacterium]|nr:hypothetical protein [Tepidisphaeraceae bacterium]